MANDYRDRETSDTADRFASLVAQFVTEYERTIQHAVAESAERQAREAGASERDIAHLSRHASCREQWRWN